MIATEDMGNRKIRNVSQKTYFKTKPKMTTSSTGIGGLQELTCKYRQTQAQPHPHLGCVGIDFKIFNNRLSDRPLGFLKMYKLAFLWKKKLVGNISSP